MDKARGVRRQKDARRDAVLTASVHRLLDRLIPPQKPIDGVLIPKWLRWYPDWSQWSGWPRVQVDVRMLGYHRVKRATP